MSNSSINSNGSVGVLSSGTDTGTIVGNGGNISTLEVTNTGIEIDGIVNSNGILNVYDGGTVSNITINTGGSLTAGTMTPSSSTGATAFILGGTISSATIMLENGALASGISAQDKASIFVMSGAEVNSATISSSNIIVYDGAVVSGGSLSLSSTETLYSTSYDENFSGNSVQNIESGGLSFSANFTDTANTQFIKADGIASGTTTHASQVISSGGTARDTRILSGGSQTVMSGGSASGTFIENGGSASISFGGVSQDIVIGSGGFLSIEAYYDGSSVGSALNVTLQSGGTLSLDDGVSVTDLTVEVGGVIDFQDMQWDSSNSFSVSGNQITITSPSGTQSITVQSPYGQLQESDFKIEDDDSGSYFGDGTELKLIACYCPETLILTPDGERRISDLNIGDKILTTHSEIRSIRWKGFRSYSAEEVTSNPALRPVIFSPGSIADGIPSRTLRVSAQHGMLIDGFLVPASALVNGKTIIIEETCENIEYFHIELETHDTVLACGAASETFVDDNSRHMFLNAADYKKLYPEAEPRPAIYCAPRVSSGSQLTIIRETLLARAMIGKIDHGFSGNIDMASSRMIRGWAKTEHKSSPEIIKIFCDDEIIATIAADQKRTDLQRAGIGNGNHGFNHVFLTPLDGSKPHTLKICRAEDDAYSENLTCHLPPESRIDHQNTPTQQAGWLDYADREELRGWAWNRATPWSQLTVEIFVNHEKHDVVLADIYRPDLEQAAIGTGRHGFIYYFNPPLPCNRRHEIEIRFPGNEQQLSGSPVTIETADTFNPELQTSITNAIAALDAGIRRTHALGFMSQQTESLRRQETERHNLRREASRLRQQRLAAGPQAADLPEFRCALIIDDRLPEIGRDAGSEAVLSHIRSLRRLGYHVTFAVAGQNTPVLPETLPEYPDVSVFGPPVCNSVEDVLSFYGDMFDVVYMHRVSVAATYAGSARRYASRARHIYSLADLHSLRMMRQANTEGNHELIRQALKIQKQELAAALMADAVITHSSIEACELTRMSSALNVHTVPWACVADDNPISASERHGVAFLGNYRHAPNIDAVMFLVRNIMPLVWEKAPHIHCIIAGQETTSDIVKLARPASETCGGIQILGPVENLADDLFYKTRISVAPIRYGAGLKGKVLESFASAIPCVMSSIAAEGINIPEELQDLVTDDAQNIADRIIALHDDPERVDRLGLIAQQLVRDEYSEESVDAALSKVLRLRNRATANLG
ncbi:MAG: Hint domain-containing protein [Acetobacter sp.]|jgi:autotransporter passenger strand-loop-strand repeat protein